MHTLKRRRHSNNQLENQAGCWHNLSITQILTKDEGLYICQIDTMSSARAVYLTVNVPPYLPVGIEDSMSVTEGISFK